MTKRKIQMQSDEKHATDCVFDETASRASAAEMMLQKSIWMPKRLNMLKSTTFWFVTLQGAAPRAAFGQSKLPRCPGINASGKAVMPIQNIMPSVD